MINDYQYDKNGWKGNNTGNACNGHIVYNGNNGCKTHKYSDGGNFYKLFYIGCYGNRCSHE